MGIRETTSASTRTSQHKKKKCNFLASLLTLSLSHLPKLQKVFFEDPTILQKHIWRKFKNLKFISSTTPDFQQVQSKNEQHCSPFTSRRISREAWTRSGAWLCFQFARTFRLGGIIHSDKKSNF